MPRVCVVFAVLFGCLSVLLAAPGRAQSRAEFLSNRMPFAAFARLPKTDIKVDGTTLRVGFAPGQPFQVGRDALLKWIARCATAVTTYYGGMSIGRPKVLVVPVSGKGVRNGKAFPYRGGAIRVLIGSHSTTHDLNRDWIMVHEMLHLTFPSVGETHSWAHEGLAVYVESIARVQAGHLPAQQIWRDFLASMPKGLPGYGDRGLDHTPTWGRIYWGGALFWLLADIDYRKRTKNTKGLQHALRAINAAGGRFANSWSIRRTFSVGDKAVGVPVLMELYEDMRAKPISTDLAQLWRDLGVQRRGRSVVFDNKAPLAHIRRAITAPPTKTPSGTL